jgi:hypothetical protein
MKMRLLVLELFHEYYGQTDRLNDFNVRSTGMQTRLKS